MTIEDKRLERFERIASYLVLGVFLFCAMSLLVIVVLGWFTDDVVKIVPIQ